MKPQSKKHSIFESIANTVIGLVTSYLAQLLVFPFYGINISHTTNIKIAIFFFIISFTRSYLVRRLFNKINQ